MVVQPKKLSGRAYELTNMENHILLMLIYYKYYISHDFFLKRKEPNKNIRYR